MSAGLPAAPAVLYGAAARQDKPCGAIEHRTPYGRIVLADQGTSLEGLGLVRVYIKREEDYAAVRAACEKRLGELPTIYAMANVCRPDLLVQIEGIAISRKSSETLPEAPPPRFRQASLASVKR